MYITTRPVSVILIIQFFVYGSVVTVARTYVYIYVFKVYSGDIGVREYYEPEEISFNR